MRAGSCCAVLVLALAGCGATGADAPKTVEDTAAKLAADSLSGLTPVPGQSVERAAWSPCSEETPGVHRSEYQRVIGLAVAKADAQKVIDQMSARWQKQGYTLKPPRPDDPRLEAQGKDDWTLLLGVEPDGSRMFLTVDSGCVHVSSDPKTG